jgi:hypothetical protein
METASGQTPQSPLLIFEESYFTAPDFLKRFDGDIRVIRNLIISRQDREAIKKILNQFMIACFEMKTDRATRIYLHLEFYVTLAYYGDAYSSVETFQNIIQDIEKPERKALLFGNSPGRANIVYGDVLLKYYGLMNDNNGGWYTEEAFEIIAKAKYYVLKAYIQFIDGSNDLRQEDQSYCLVMLAACFMHLSRWFEPIYYTGLLKARDDMDPNYEYIVARNLEALKEKTCLDYNGQLLLRIMDCCNGLKNHPHIDERRKLQAVEMYEKCKNDIRRANLSVERLKKHQVKVENDRKKTNPYFIFCEGNQLFLNEHSLFCPCGRSIGDTLKIRTHHPHTQMEWVLKFELLLDLLMADFSVARRQLFDSQQEKKPASFYVRENRKPNAQQYKKDALLKDAFKLCYSILDKVCYGIFEVMGINIEDYLKSMKQKEGKQAPKLYFLNMWELYHFEEQDFRKNLYLISLLSIARDLDRTDYSALQSFKKYRNAMEHNFLFISESDIKAPKGVAGGLTVNRQSLVAKTKLLMVLTKSAIFSFAYLVRRQSKILEVAARSSN